MTLIYFLEGVKDEGFCRFFGVLLAKPIFPYISKTFIHKRLTVLRSIYAYNHVILMLRIMMLLRSPAERSVGMWSKAVTEWLLRTGMRSVGRLERAT